MVSNGYLVVYPRQHRSTVWIGDREFSVNPLRDRATLDAVRRFLAEERHQHPDASTVILNVLPLEYSVGDDSCPGVPSGLRAGGWGARRAHDTPCTSGTHRDTQ